MSGDLAKKDCIPCRGGVPPLPPAEQAKLLAQLSGWRLNTAGHLEKEYEFKGFRPGFEFAKRVGEMCEQVGHHGDFYLAWGKLRLEVWTHKIGGLVEADFIWAAKADALLDV